MTIAAARTKLATLRPDAPAITGITRRAYGWVADDADGGFYCLVTGRYTLPPQDPAERFGGDER